MARQSADDLTAIMSVSSSLNLPRSVRQTLHWFLPESALEQPFTAQGEERYLLNHAQRLHESISRVPAPGSTSARCLILGSTGAEVPYLHGKLGWRHITCVNTPEDDSPGRRRRARPHPNGRDLHDFTQLEHDVETGPLPLKAESFDLVILWNRIEHWRHDPEFVLYDLNRVCRPQATLSLVTANAISFQATHALLRGEPVPLRLQWPEADSPCRRYAPKEVAALLAGTGWQVEKLTTIVPDPPVYWRWWKRWVFRRVVGRLRQGFGLAEPFWNAHILAQAVKAREARRSFPGWLYKDQKIRQLKLEMLDLLDGSTSRRQRRARRPA